MMFRILAFTAAILLCLSFSQIRGQDQYELTEIRFEGNESLPSGDLKEVIYSEETPFWLWKFLNTFTPLGAPPVYFDSTSIPVDMKALEQYYNTNGFFSSRIMSDFQLDTLNKEAVLIYKIYEGKPSSYGKFKFTGLDSIPQALLQLVHKTIFVDSSERYNQPILEANINSTVNNLMNNGYMLAKFDSTVIYRDTSNLKADIEIFYTTGNHFVVDTIKVTKQGEGAGHVDDDDIIRITDLNKGEQFNAGRIRASQERLFRTGVFNSINIRPYAIDSIKSEQVNLDIQGNIGEMNELSPEIITNNQANALNVGLGATYTRKNFFGSMRKFSLSGSFGLQDIFSIDYSNLFQRFSFRDTTLLGYVDSRMTIEQPYLFNKLIYGILEFYANINKQVNYNNTIYGSKLTFDFELPQFTFINFLKTYYNVEMSNEVYRTNNDSLSRKLISAVGTDFGKSTTDNALFPTKGINASIQLEEANLLPYLIGNLIGDKFTGALFYRVLFNSAYYKALDSKRLSIIAAKFKTGHLQPYKGDYAGLPINRTFYAGGSNSVRGWRVNELYPREAPSILNEINNNGVNYKGGTFLLESSLEYRYRFLESFGAAIFADAGNAWLSYKDFRFDGTALAAGAGLRYYSSVAPFRFDFGIKFYNPDTKKFIFSQRFWQNIVFHFGIGEAF